VKKGWKVKKAWGIGKGVKRDDYLLTWTDKRRRQQRVKNRKVWMMGDDNESCWN